MNKQIRINISSMLLIYAFFMTPMVWTHSATLLNSAALLVLTFCCNYLGAFLLSYSAINEQNQPVTHAGISIFIGMLTYAVAIFVSATPGFLLLFTAITTIGLLLASRKRTAWSFDIPKTSAVVFISSLIAFILVSADDISVQFVAHQTGSRCYTTDTYFFTSMVSSIRHGSIFNASFEVGSPLNNQVLGLFAPAFFANVLNISSHQALWGLVQPLYKLTAFFLCYELAWFHLKPYVKKDNYLFPVLAILLPIILAPLHFLYLAKLDVKNFIFNGIGYLIPAGTVAYPTGIVLFLFSLLIFSNIDWKNKKISADKILFVVSVAILILAKVPFYQGFVVFIAVILIKRILVDREKVTAYVGYIVASLVLAYCLNKICMGTESGLRTYLKYGYIEETFAQLYHIRQGGVKGQVITIGLIIFSYLFWLSIRLVGLVGLVQSGKPAFIEYFIGGIFSLLGATFLASFLHMEFVDKNGYMHGDLTFNSIQFVRASFYILTIVSCIGLLYMLYGQRQKQWLRTALFVIIGLWSIPTLATIAYGYTHKNKCEPLAWYDENYNELKTGKYNDGLIAVNPSLNYYGVMMAGSDLGTYWSAMDHSVGNYNLSVKSVYRWELFKSLVKNPEEAHLVAMHKDGVKYIISTPEDSAAVSKAAALFPNHLARAGQSRWIFEVK